MITHTERHISGPTEGGADQPITDRVEVGIIGAGQAGLSVSHYLTEQGRDHVVLERATRFAEPWRTGRWDSFTLVTPNWALQLPGCPYHGDNPDGFLDRTDVVRYIEEYAASFRPPVRFGVEVSAVEPHPSGAGFVIATNTGLLAADNVVVATGAHQQPNVPAIAEDLPRNLQQLHSSEYRNPNVLPPGAVLVVGSAQSGAQIAEELYQSGRQVYLSVGGTGRAPRGYRGRDIFWWLVQVGFFNQPIDHGFAAPHVSGKDGGRTLNLHQFARDGVQLLGHLRGADHGTLQLAPDLHESLAKSDGFAAQGMKMIDEFVTKTGLDVPPAEVEPAMRDGFAIEPRTELDLTAAGITSVVWATGYGFDFNWVRFPVFDDHGFPVQQQGATDVRGLYFVGMSILKSVTFAGVGEDAARVVAAIAARADAGQMVGAGVGGQR